MDRYFAHVVLDRVDEVSDVELTEAEFTRLTPFAEVLSQPFSEPFTGAGDESELDDLLDEITFRDAAEVTPSIIAAAKTAGHVLRIYYD